MALASYSLKILRVIVAGSYLLGPATVRAESNALTLAWHAPVGCPDSAQVEREVRRLLGPKAHFAATLVAEARTEFGSDQRYRLTLHTTQAGVAGERSFSANSCRAVSDAAIVTMALSLDPNLELPKDYGSQTVAQPRQPNAVQDEPDGPAPPTVATPPRTKKQPTQSQSPQPGQSASTAPTALTFHLQLRSIVGWRWGALPNSTGEFGIGVGAAVGRTLTYVAATLSPATTAFSDLRPNSGGRFFMQAGELGGCVALFDAALDLLPCVGMAFTHISAEGVNVAPKQEGSLYWLSPLLGLELRYRPAKRVALFVGTAAVVAPHRPEAYVFGTDTIFKPDPVAIPFRGGAELTIW